MQDFCLKKLKFVKYKKLTNIYGSSFIFRYQRWVPMSVAIKINVDDTAVLLITAITAVINFIATLD